MLQPAAVIFPDAELWWTAYLRTALAARPEPYAAGAFVSNKKPTANRPKTVVVRRDGGPQIDLFDFPRLTVRVWDDDEQTASNLALLVLALCRVAPGNGPVVSIESSSGPQGVPDSAQPQKFLNVQPKMRGVDL